MTNPDIVLQDRLLPPLDRELLIRLAPLADSATKLDNSQTRKALYAIVPAILRTGRTLRYVEAVLGTVGSPGWLVAHAKADAKLRDAYRNAMLAGGEALASHHANELLDGDQPKVKAFGILIKQQATETKCLESKRSRTGSWVDDIINRDRDF